MPEVERDDRGRGGLRGRLVHRERHETEGERDRGEHAGNHDPAQMGASRHPGPIGRKRLCLSGKSGPETPRARFPGPSVTRAELDAYGQAPDVMAAPGPAFL